MKSRSIKRNYILNTAYQVLTLITPLITAPYISRVLGAEGVGTYSYTVSVVAFFTMFAVLGTTTYGQRAIAQCRDDREVLSKTFWEIELLSVVTTLASVATWAIFVALSTKNRLYFTILTIDLVAVGFDIIWFYSGLEFFDMVVFRNAAVKLVGIVLMFLLVKKPSHVWVYISILSAGKLLGNMSMWIPLRSLVDHVPISELSIRNHLKETLAYFIPTAAASIYTYLDKVMIGNYTTSALENGYYEQANKIVNMAYTLLVSINTVMSARMSYLFAQGEVEEIRAKLERALSFLVTLGVPLAFGIAGVSSNFVGWFFGSEFNKVALLMNVAAPLVPIMSIHNFLSAQYLVPSGQRVRSTKGVIVGALVNFALNLALIPRFQSVGAAVATVMSEIAICAVYFHMSKEFVPVIMMLTHSMKPVLASMAMFVVLLLLGRGHYGSPQVTVVQVAVGIVVYGCTMLLMRDSFTIELLRMCSSRVKRLLGGRRPL